MSQAIKIEVTADDIAKGVECGWNNCPVALAIRRRLPGLPCLKVNKTVASWRVGDVVTRIKLPAKAIDFIRCFDHGQRDSNAVHPFTFSVTPKEMRT